MSTPSITCPTCPTCGKTSYHPKDIEHKYCGFCNVFHDNRYVHTFIMDNQGNIFPEDSFLEWAKWFEKAGESRIIQKSYVGDVDVSTVFLGINHAWRGGRPLIFESMTFSETDRFNHWQDRYSTKEEAIAGHWEMHRHVEVEYYSVTNVARRLGVKLLSFSKRALARARSGAAWFSQTRLHAPQPQAGPATGPAAAEPQT